MLPVHMLVRARAKSVPCVVPIAAGTSMSSRGICSFISGRGKVGIRGKRGIGTEGLWSVGTPPHYSVRKCLHSDGHQHGTFGVLRGGYHACYVMSRKELSGIR